MSSGGRLLRQVVLRDWSSVTRTWRPGCQVSRAVHVIGPTIPHPLHVLQRRRFSGKNACIPRPPHSSRTSDWKTPNKAGNARQNLRIRARVRLMVRFAWRRETGQSRRKSRRTQINVSFPSPFAADSRPLPDAPRSACEDPGRGRPASRRPFIGHWVASRGAVARDCRSAEACAEGVVARGPEEAVGIVVEGAFDDEAAAAASRHLDQDAEAAVERLGELAADIDRDAAVGADRKCPYVTSGAPSSKSNVTATGPATGEVLATST